MIDEDMAKQARRVFKTACTIFDEKGFKCEKDEENFSISCCMQGDDLDITIEIKIDPEVYSVLVYSVMPFRVLPEKKDAMAVAVSRANWGLPDGIFDYNYEHGKILFRTNMCYKDSLISNDVFNYMVGIVCYFVDKYNDRFFAVSKSDMTFDEIMKFID